MSNSSRRAVLTGMGVLCPLGLGHASFWERAMAGRSGVRAIQSFDASALPVRIAGEIPEFDAKSYLEKKDRKSLKVMARTIQLAVAAAQVALDDSGVDKARLDPTRFGIEFGSGLIASELQELGDAALVSADDSGVVDLEKWGDQGLATMTPLWMLKYLPNMLACHVSILHNAQGPNNTVTESDVASLLALGEAYRILVRDQADFMLCGGAESKVNPLSMVRQCLFEPLSHRNDAPEKASRPFDRDRDGLVVGEGGGILVMEELEHARRRGAKIYAEVVGFGAAYDYRKDGAGVGRAVLAALHDAGIGPEDIDHVNANGLSAVESDICEARGLQAAFGNCKSPVPVLAVKSYIGNLGAASVPVELAASLSALQHGVVPPTLNYEKPDPACPVTVLSGAPKPLTKQHVLKVSFTQMGQCAALVCKKWL